MREALRFSELVDLRWDQMDFGTATLHVRRVKQGTLGTHPILGDLFRALRRLQREQGSKSPFVLTSERGATFTTAGFARMASGRQGSKAQFQNTPAPAQTRLRLRAPTKDTTRGRPKPVPRASQYSEYGAVHRTIAFTLHGLLARLKVRLCSRLAKAIPAVNLSPIAWEFPVAGTWVGVK